MTANLLLKRFMRPSLLLLLGVSLNACAGLFGFGGTSWKEEVLFHDGRRVIVDRSLERGGRHEIGQRGGSVHQTLTFIMPGTQQEVVWEDKRSEDIGNASFSPMLLDVVKDTAYVVASPAGCLAYNKWGRPNPPYVIFKYQGKDWNRVPLEELPKEIKTPNLIFSSPDDEAKKTGQAIVPAETIRALYAGYYRPEQKTILREALPNGIGCPVPSDAAAKPIAPEIDGKPLYYNWWPLAQEWLNNPNRNHK